MTQKQRIFFFRLFAKACSARGIPPAEREAYRHNLIAHACPLSGGSLRNVGTGEDFDRLMRVLAREAQSAEATQHFATADVRRVAKLCEACARQVWEIAAEGGKFGGLEVWKFGDAGASCEGPSGRPSKQPRSGGSRCEASFHGYPPSIQTSTPEAYLRAIMAQAGWRWAIVASGDGWWLDLPRPHAERLLMMLDTHRRRLLRRVHNKWERLQDGSQRPMRLTFDPGSVYRWEDDILWREEPAALPEPRVRIRVTA